jgi:hypothetical protein
MLETEIFISNILEQNIIIILNLGNVAENVYLYNINVLTLYRYTRNEISTFSKILKNFSKKLEK